MTMCEYMEERPKYLKVGNVYTVEKTGVYGEFTHVELMPPLQSTSLKGHPDFGGERLVGSIWLQKRDR